MKWREPPSRGLHERIFSEQVLAELRAHPGQWAELRSYKGKGAWNKPQMLNVPYGIEIRAGWEDAERTRSVLFARAVPTNGKVKR